MPLVDMPLDQLHVYQGRNPKPDDFDLYWEAALEEVASIEPNVDARSSEFQTSFAKCDDLYFRGTRDARIYAKKLSPPGKPLGALLLFHGYSVDSGDWSDKLAYVAAGWTVYAMDVRGQGGRSQDPGGHLGNTLRGHIIRGLDGPVENAFYRQVFLDTVQLARIAREEGAVTIGAMGASQGGGLAFACAALSKHVDKVVAWYPFLSDYQRVWEMDLARDAYDELKQYFRRFDQSHFKSKETWTKLGYIDVQHLASRIKASTLMITGLMDTVCPPSTQFAAYNKILVEKQLAIYPDFGHEGIPGSNDRAFNFLNADRA